MSETTPVNVDVMRKQIADARAMQRFLRRIPNRKTPDHILDALDKEIDECEEGLNRTLEAQAAQHPSGH